MIHTSAPATLMLMGEHAVLRGKHALVASVNQRLHVYLKPRKDRLIRIDSSLGKHECSLDKVEIKAPFEFILTLIKQFQKHFETGFDLKIKSDFSSTVGLGSSAAILVATAEAILTFLGFELRSHEILFDISYKALLKVQGQGSGADLAASILGGIVCYRNTPFAWTKLPVELFPITLVYSGYKTPTPEVIKIVNEAYKKDPKKFEILFEAIGEATLFAKEALEGEDLTGFLNAFKSNQQLMVEMGVVDETLQKIVDTLSQDPGILAAKVSGSGLGDCVIGVGTAKNKSVYTAIPVALSYEGVMSHED